MGSAHLGSGGTIHEIKSTQSPTGEHGDISAIEIRPPKKMKAGGFPLVMTSMKHPVAGSAARVVGYGRILPETRGNERLREVDVPVLRREVCGRAYGGGIMSVQRVCAGYMAGGCDACSGDSGGPMVQFAGGREILVGIVSTGKGCAERGFPGIYTRVGGFMGGFERGGVEFQGVREIEGGEGEEDDGEDIHEDEEEGGVVSVIVEEDGEEDVEVVEEVEEVEEEDDSSNATVMVERNVETASLRIPIWPILAPVGVVALSSIILIQM